MPSGSRDRLPTRGEGPSGTLGSSSRTRRIETVDLTGTAESGLKAAVIRRVTDIDKTLREKFSVIDASTLGTSIVIVAWTGGCMAYSMDPVLGPAIIDLLNTARATVDHTIHHRLTKDALGFLKPYLPAIMGTAATFVSTMASGIRKGTGLGLVEQLAIGFVVAGAGGIAQSFSSELEAQKEGAIVSMIFQALASPFGGKLVSKLSDAFSWIKDKRTQWAQSPSTLTNTIISFLLWTGVMIAITEAVLVYAGYIGPEAALKITGDAAQELTAAGSSTISYIFAEQAKQLSFVGAVAALAPQSFSYNWLGLGMIRAGSGQQYEVIDKLRSAIQKSNSTLTDADKDLIDNLLNGTSATPYTPVPADWGSVIERSNAQGPFDVTKTSVDSKWTWLDKSVFEAHTRADFPPGITGVAIDASGVSSHFTPVFQMIRMVYSNNGLLRIGGEEALTKIKTGRYKHQWTATAPPVAIGDLPSDFLGKIVAEMLEDVRKTTQKDWDNIANRAVRIWLSGLTLTALARNMFSCRDLSLETVGGKASNFTGAIGGTGEFFQSVDLEVANRLLLDAWNALCKATDGIGDDQKLKAHVDAIQGPIGTSSSFKGQLSDTFGKFRREYTSNSEVLRQLLNTEPIRDADRLVRLTRMALYWMIPYRKRGVGDGSITALYTRIGFMAPNSTCDDCGTDKKTLYWCTEQKRLYGPPRARFALSMWFVLPEPSDTSTAQYTNVFTAYGLETKAYCYDCYCKKCKALLGKLFSAHDVQYGVEATARTRGLQVVKSQLDLVKKMWEGDAGAIKAAESEFVLQAERDPFIRSIEGQVADLTAV